MSGSEELVATLVDIAEAKQAALSELNQQLGKDVSKLSKIENIVAQLQATKHAMEEKLLFVSTAAPDQISVAVQAAQDGLAQADELQKEACLVQEQGISHTNLVSELLGPVLHQLQLVEQLDKVRCYQGWVRSVQQISCEMCAVTPCGSDEPMLLSRYRELERTLQHLAGETSCDHLLDYVINTVMYWHARLLHTFTQEFENLLKVIKYPFISTNTNAQQSKPTPDQLSRLQTLTKHLLALQTCPDALLSSASRGRRSDVKDKVVEGKHNSKAILVTPVRTDKIICGDDNSNFNAYLPSESQYIDPSANTSSDLYTSVSSSPCKSTSPTSTCLDTSATSDVVTGPTVPSIVADFAPLLIPIKLLIKPLEVRFQFHFSGNKKTNSPAHPEWCLTRVLNWVADHAALLSGCIQPVLDDCHYGHVRAQTEFTRDLVRLVVLKLSEDLSHVMNDEDLFCHLLQETLNFERELRLSCGYPACQPSVLVVVTQPQVLTQWIRLERKFSVAVMDALVSDPGAWTSEAAEKEDGGGGVTACGEQLVTLLQGITERYESLSQPGHRLQFLEVQLDVLDEFRLRAAQLSRQLLPRPAEPPYTAILNTLHHLADVLRDWGDVPFFLVLSVYRRQQQQLEAAMGDIDVHLDPQTCPTLLPVEGGVFEERVLLFEHVQQEMLGVLHNHVMTLVRARFMPYRRDRWHIDHVKNRPSSCCDVSPSLCPLLEVLARELHALTGFLARPLFAVLWQALARDMDKYFFEELVMQNHFSDQGCSQLEFDMTKALFMMFSEFTVKPENYFLHMKESLTLLTLPLASALLLRDTLRLAGQDDYTHNTAADITPAAVEPEDALADHGVTTLTPDHALAVLSARNSLSSI